MRDIKDVAVACWRLEKWVDKTNVEKKMAAKSALRILNEYLLENGIEIRDLTGERFSSGLSVEVIGNESEETDAEKLIIRETIKPVLLENGSVIQAGQVILAKKEESKIKE